jgi:integrase/recombinase XerC
MTSYFFLKDYVRKRDGKAKIMLTIQDGTKKKRFATRLAIEPKYFQNKHNHWIKKSHPHYITLNHKLAVFYQEHKAWDPHSEDPSISKCFEIYLGSSHYLGLAPTTQMKVNGILMGEWKIHFESLGLWAKPYLTLSPRVIKSITEKMRLSGLSDQTIYKKVATLKSLFNQLYKKLAIIEQNPIDGVSVPNPKPIKEAIPKKEIIALLQYVPKTAVEELTTDLWKFSFYSQGLRISDVVSLEYDHIDWEDRRVQRIQTKTKQPISFAITSETQRLIEKYQNQSAFVFDLGFDPSDPRSVDRINARIRKSLKHICKKLNLKHLGHIHTARSSYAQIMSAQIPLTELSASLGHASTITTHEYLGRHMNYADQELDLKLNSALGL